MNIGLLGVIPAGEIAGMAGSAVGNFPAARAAQVIYGSWGGTVVAILVMWTAFASIFSLLAGYSRIPFAAARDGNFFALFQKIHPQHKFPIVSVLVLGGLAALLCIFQLKDLVSALVVIRIMLLFALQAIGVVVWRRTNPDQPRPFRMWLYPLPVIITLIGFSLVLYDKRALVFRGLLFAAVGIAFYLLRSAKRRDWPFQRSQA
jgi:amino acid transporter